MSDPFSGADFAAQMVRQTAQSGALGLEHVDAGPGVGAMRVPFKDELVGDPAAQVLAGGVITTLIDHTCGFAIGLAMREAGAMPAAGSPQMGSMATLDLRIDYMRPAKPRAGVTAHARCYKLTHSVAFVRAVAFDEDEADPVATAQAAFAINRASPEAAP